VLAKASPSLATPRSKVFLVVYKKGSTELSRKIYHPQPSNQEMIVTVNLRRVGKEVEIERC
jgi:hypothetical protein